MGVTETADLRLLDLIQRKLGPITHVAVRCPRCRSPEGLTVPVEGPIGIARCTCGYRASTAYLLDQEIELRLARETATRKTMEESPRRKEGPR